jgi:hypothetical protein
MNSCNGIGEIEMDVKAILTTAATVILVVVVDKKFGISDKLLSFIPG